MELTLSSSDLSLEPQRKRQKKEHEFHCPSCESVVNVEETNWSKSLSQNQNPTPTPTPAQKEKEMGSEEEELELLEVSSVKCTSCDKSVGMFVHGQFQSVATLLRDDSRKELNSWCRVKDESDRRVLFILSQIIYKEYEMPDESADEVEFAFPLSKDLAKIFWRGGEAIGFYTVKLKGTLDTETLSYYTMDSLDTIFIRRQHRRQKFASSAIIDLLSDFPDQNIGFSYPISIAMMKVLANHLENRVGDRPLLWEIENYGAIGNCRNLWLVLQRQRKVGGPKKPQLTN